MSARQLGPCAICGAVGYNMSMGAPLTFARNATEAKGMARARGQDRRRIQPGARRNALTSH